MKSFCQTALLIMAIVTSISGLAYAHSGTKGVVKERMEVMGEIAKAMKTIGKMLKGEVSYDPGIAKAAALDIATHTTNITRMFPDGTTQNPSEALPIIWEDWDEFVEMFNKLELDAKLLAETAGSASNVNAIKPQFGIVSRSCKSCHEKFRLKKK